jgi:methionyl-tRNA synthetase
VAALVTKAGAPLRETPEAAIVEATKGALAGAREAYLALELREVVRLANQVADRCNKRLQEAKPWEDPSSPASRALLFTVGKALRGIATLLWPVMPRFADGLAAAFGQARPAAWEKGFDPFDGPAVVAAGKPPQIARLDAKQTAKLIVVPPEAAQAAPAAPAAKPAGGGASAPAVPGVIGYDEFAKVELRVAVVRTAERVKGADKLLHLTVDAGDPEPRTIVAGIALAYPDPAVLVGKRIVVVANLAPRPLRGITSHGMLLAAGEAPNLQVVTVGEGIAPGTRVK